MVPQVIVDERPLCSLLSLQNCTLCGHFARKKSASASVLMYGVVRVRADVRVRAEVRVHVDVRVPDEASVRVHPDVVDEVLDHEQGVEVVVFTIIFTNTAMKELILLLQDISLSTSDMKWTSLMQEMNILILLMC